MKKIISLLLFLSLTFNCYAQDVIAEFSNESLPVLNEELRKIRNDIDDKSVSQIRTLFWYIADDITTGTNKSGRFDVPFNGTITKATTQIGTVPTGAILILDINKNGTSIWNTTQGNRLQIAINATNGSQTSFDTTTVSINNYFTLDVDQIGSTVAGANLSVQLQIQESLY